MREQGFSALTVPSPGSRLTRSTRLSDERVETDSCTNALAAQARLAGIPIAADDHGLDGRIDVGVLAHDHRVRAAELERDPLELRAGH
jgi:hypothetical protein